MPVATVRGVDINYEVLGERGHGWHCSPAAGADSPASNRSAKKSPRPAAGCSSMTAAIAAPPASSFDGGNSENEIWAEDLATVVAARRASGLYRRQLVGLPPGIAVALRHPADVRGLCCGASPAAPMRRSAWSRITTASLSMRPSGAAWKRFAAPSISPR